MRASAKRAIAIAGASAAAALLAGGATLVTSQPAAATAKFAKQTGKACSECHTDPEGGGALSPFGEKFKANGNKLPK